MSKNKTNDSEHDAKLSALETGNDTPTPELKKIEKVVEPIDPISGWIDIKRDEIPYEGKLYEQSYRFQVKPVNTDTIKYFSSMDENNALSVNDALTYVINKHVRILDGNKLIDVLDTIYEHDRFFFVMLVHTYTGSTTALKFPTNCKVDGTCNHKQDAIISPYNLQVKPLEEKAWSYLNPELGKFVIETKTLGRWTFKPLTLKLSGEITEFMMKQRREGVEVDKTFLKVAPFLNMSERAPGQSIETFYHKYFKLTDSATKITLINRLEKMLAPEQLTEILVDCEKCQRPFRTPISSVAGLRDIFFVHDIDGELS